MPLTARAMGRVAALTAALCGVPAVVSEIVLDGGNAAHVFDGIGALSAGASSRLLWDYDVSTRAEILDLLFRPQYGASLQILKVEIGGDTQSTDGSEPSHEHEDGNVDCTRGYEGWLIKEARKRNPEILTYGLSWGVPGWVGNGSYFSSDNIRYQVDWMKCMRSFADVEVDFLGIWNERPWGSASYTVQLRQALDQAGFQATKLVMLDGGLNRDFLSTMASNATFRNSFDVVGLHYPCDSPSPDVLAQGKKYWSSEEASTPADWSGAGCWGRVLNTNYVRMNMTASIMWSLIWSAYSNLDCFGNGMMYAFQPWSGKYSVNSPVWASAHMTQFTKPGWRYLRPGSAELPGGGTHVALVDGHGNFTLVLETLNGKCMYHHGCSASTPASVPQVASFRLVKDLHAERLLAWQTNITHQFVRLEDVPVAADGSFQVTMPPDAIMTLTTPGNGGQSKAAGSALPPTVDGGATDPFPLPYHEDFSIYPKEVSGVMPRYFADQSGSWEAFNGSLHQVVRRAPGKNQWTCNSEPLTVLGDSNWTDYVTSVRARIDTTSITGSGSVAYVAVCARVLKYAGFACGLPSGYCLRVAADGSWQLAVPWPSDGQTEQILASGKGVGPSAGRWHSMRLEVRGRLVVASLNGAHLASVSVTRFEVGQIALQSSWHAAEFDDLEVLPLQPPESSAQLQAATTLFRTLSIRTYDWELRSCVPVPRDAGRGLRNDFTGFVGMRIQVKRRVQLAYIGRWRTEGDTGSHSLLLLTGEKEQKASVILSPTALMAEDGFAYTAINMALEPGEYYLLSEELKGGDFWLDQGVGVEEEDWVNVVSAVWGTTLENLQASLRHTTYGPLNLKLVDQPLPEAFV